ncbi:MAG: Rdx family protein [Ilumatobacteraceae bacterium]|nr:Rdx family protein [Ilumatobacteraceae bacterium]
MSAARDLVHHYQHVIEALTLVTGSAGVFDVVVNDEFIYSKAKTGRHAEPGEVLALFTEFLPSDTPRYERS